MFDYVKREYRIENQQENLNQICVLCIQCNSVEIISIILTDKKLFMPVS